MKKLIRKSLSFLVYAFGLRGRVRDFIMWPLASRLLGVKYTEVITLKNGVEFCADMSDIVGRMILFYGEHVEYAWEPATTQLVERLSREARVSILAGSHIGYTVVHALAAKKQDAHVYAFEPVNYLYELSRKNIALQNTFQSSGGATLEKKALGERTGVAEIAPAAESM